MSIATCDAYVPTTKFAAISRVAGTTDGVAPSRKGAQKRVRNQPYSDRKDIQDELLDAAESMEGQSESEATKEAKKELKRLGEEYVQHGKRKQEYALLHSAAKVMKLQKRDQSDVRRSLHNDIAFVEERMQADDQLVAKMCRAIEVLDGVEQVATEALEKVKKLSETIKSGVNELNVGASQAAAAMDRARQ